MSLHADVAQLLGRAAAALAGTEAEDQIRALQQRLDGPIRVAIAGRIKAGKSTLLNALVGERLAPTDARECTRIVTWYLFGDSYAVEAQLPDGESLHLPFRRDDGRMEIPMTEEEADVTERIVVRWPSARLRNMTIIDTPGLASAVVGRSERTEAALAAVDAPSEADAVIYLLRHVHASDVSFLEAFLDEQLAEVSPVNSVGVLSRADEVGGGRLDSLDSAHRVAARYAADPRVRSLVSTVIPVAGLLAETAASLEEREAEWLRIVAREPEAVREQLLLSVDDFRETLESALTVEIRELLLQRFGLFGLRRCVAGFVAGEWGTATELSRLLARESGIGELEDLVRRRFAGRSRQLVARTVLEALRHVVEGTAGGNAVLRDLEQLESASHEVAELRLMDMVWSGAAAFSEAERAEAERATAAATPASRLGLPDEADSAELLAAAIAAVARWRERGADALSDRQTGICCETMARCYEGIYATLVSPHP